jgi:hypothetical protein
MFLSDNVIKFVGKKGKGCRDQAIFALIIGSFYDQTTEDDRYVGFAHD